MFLSQQYYFHLKDNNNIGSLFKWTGNEMEFIKKTSLPNTLYATNDKWFVCFNKRYDKLIIINMKSDEQDVLSIKLPIRKGLCLDLYNNYCFIGGYGELLALDLEILTFQNLEIPAIIKKKRKSIDEILIDDGKIYVLDNVVTPKWLIVYSLNNYIVEKCLKLKNNGTNENFERMISNSECLILLSTCSGRQGSSQHLTIINKSNYIQYSFFIFISITHKNEKSSNKIIEDGLYIVAIQILENFLFLVSDDGRIYYLKLDGFLLNVNPQKNKISRYSTVEESINDIKLIVQNLIIDKELNKLGWDNLTKDLRNNQIIGHNSNQSLTNWKTIDIPI